MKKLLHVFFTIFLTAVVFFPVHAQEKFKYRGVIEGFYGPAWTFEGRMNAMPFFKRCGFNTYIYAPKDDPYHRDKWRESYPVDTMKLFWRLRKEAEANELTFCYALSPGLSYRFTNSKDYDALVKKLKDMQDIGTKCFALFFDDIPIQLSDPSDKKKYAHSGEAQVAVTNKIYAELKAKNKDAQMLFTPTEYIGTTSSPYLLSLQKLHKDIPVFWTGMQVVSAEITAAQAKAFGKLIGRKPVIWDNYPVNDYNRSRLFIGPVQKRTADLYKEVSGILSNPMNELEASKFALLTYSDYFKDPENYNPEKSWHNALKETIGDVAYKDFYFFAEHTMSTPFKADEAPQLRQLISDFWDAHKTKNKGGTWLPQANALKDYFIKMKETGGALKTKITDKDLLKELSPFFDKFSAYGEVGEKSMSMIIGAGNYPQMIEPMKEEFNEAVKKARGIQKTMCGDIMLKFIRKVSNLKL